MKTFSLECVRGGVAAAIRRSNHTCDRNNMLSDLIINITMLTSSPFLTGHGHSHIIDIVVVVPRKVVRETKVTCITSYILLISL